MNTEQVDQDAILSSLRRISRAIDVHSRRLSRDHLLTAPQLVCLRALQSAGSMMPSELAREVNLSQATVTGILDRLSDRRLISRRRNPSDKRCVTVKVTPVGRELLESAPSALHEGFSKMFDTLAPSERESIAAALARVAEMMEATPAEPGA